MSDVCVCVCASSLMRGDNSRPSFNLKVQSTFTQTKAGVFQQTQSTDQSGMPHFINNPITPKFCGVNGDIMFATFHFTVYLKITSDAFLRNGSMNNHRE